MMTVHSRILNNAQEITRLHRRVRELVPNRYHDAHTRSQWEAACAEFHVQYEELAFPNGPRNAHHRLRAGDPEAMEYALALLEVRPYFFRSGYMYSEFMRVLRNCSLSPDQRSRYDLVRAAYDEYRISRRKT